MTDLHRHLAPLARGIRNLLARAIVRLVDDARQMQELQVEATRGEVLDGVEHWHPYGFTTHPRIGAEALLLSVGGSRSRAVVVAVADRRYRLTGLAQGEVALHDDQGQSIILRRSGIEITGDLKITGDVTVLGKLDQTGDQTVSGTLTIAGIDFAEHVHPGVASGGAETGVPQ